MERGTATTTTMGGPSSSLFGAVAQILQQEAVEPIKAKAISRPSTSLPDKVAVAAAAGDDEKLVQVIRTLFTL
jgi:hypothetical protein